MSARSAAGYVLLFLFLFLLILVHSAFILLFFLGIIIAIMYKVGKHKKAKRESDAVSSEDYNSDDSDSDDSDSKDYGSNVYDPTDSSSKDCISRYYEKIDRNRAESEGESKDTLIRMQREDEIARKIGIDKRAFDHAYREMEGNVPFEIIKDPKKTLFDRRSWNFYSDESNESKKRKILKATSICEENNLGSQRKLQSIKKKMRLWGIENERDIDAIRPDYEHLLELIKEHHDDQI